jgi:hypothetical protein
MAVEEVVTDERSCATRHGRPALNTPLTPCLTRALSKSADLLLNPTVFALVMADSEAQWLLQRKR